MAAFGPQLNRRQRKVVTVAGETTTADFDLSIASDGGSQTITVKNLQVTIAEEATFLVAGLDEPLTLEQYVDYSREKLLALMPGWEQMLRIWQDEALRLETQDKLEQASVHPDVLAEVLKTPEADPLDVLGYVAYQRQPIPTRAERAERFMEQEQAWLAGFPPDAQVVLAAMMEKYRLGGLRQISDPAIFRLPPFKAMGELRGVSQRFGDANALRQTMLELQRRLYSV